MQCEMCGEEKKLVPTIVEGTELQVCQACAKHGKVLKRPVLRQQIQRTERETIVQRILPAYGGMIQRTRDRLGLRQKDLAKRMGERESVIQSIESGKHEPSIRLARKFEKFLKIRLIEQVQEKKYDHTTEDRPGMTMADLLKK